MNNNCNNKNSNRGANSKRGGNSRNKGNRGKDMRNNTIQRNEDVSNASNSVADYALDSQLLKDVASIPFSWAVGTPLNLNNELLSGLTSKGSFTVPGICRLVVQPSIGHAKMASDPVNIAANRIYSYVRHANSGSKNYDAPDLMLYLIAVANVYGYIMQLQRVLGVIGTYSAYNRYIPDQLVGSMGADANSLRSNLANFRGRLNMLITKAASFAIPSNMPYFRNMVESLGNYYIEGNSMKDQIYFVYSVGFYKYQLNTDGSGMLKIRYIDYFDVDSLIRYGEEMLDVLIYSEDMNIMSGDILKAYGVDGIYKLATVPEGFSLLPLFDVPVLEQIKNATTVGILMGGSSRYVVNTDVVQEPNHAFLTSACNVTTHSNDGDDPTAANAVALSLRTLDEDRIMTTMSKDVSPELVMEYSKFMVAGMNYSHEPGSSVASLDLYPRTFVPLNFDVIYGDVQSDGTIKWVGNPMTYATPINLTNAQEMANWIHKYALLRYFKFVPALHTLGYRPGSAAPAVNFAASEMFQDVDNYAVVSDSTLAAIHEAALLSLFHVVSIAQK